MATLTNTYHKLYILRLATTKKVDQIFEALLPRRCMVISTSLFLIGLGIPLMMVIGLLPVNLLLGFIGFALTSTGGVLILILCGEI